MPTSDLEISVIYLQISLIYLQTSANICNYVYVRIKCENGLPY